MCPFEIFFGRRPLPDESSKFDESKQIHFKQWFEKVEKLHETANKFQTKAAESMVKRHKANFPPSVYNVGEEVIVKERFMGKKIKSNQEKRIFKGKVVESRENR
jgi:predicted Ser/Thr protein kinase